MNSHSPADLLQRVWTALRTLPTFTFDELLMAAVDGDEKDPLRHIHTYVHLLACAGYVRPLTLKESGRTSLTDRRIRWRLISDTGPQAPVHRIQRHVLFDPNLKREIALGRDVSGVAA